MNKTTNKTNETTSRASRHVQLTARTAIGSIAIFGIMFAVGAMASHNFMPVKDSNAASVSGGVKLEAEVVDSLAMRITSNSDDGVGFLGVDPSGTESIDPSTGEAESEIAGPSLAYAELNANSTDFTTLYSNIEVRSNTGKFRLTMQDADTDTALGDSTAGEYHYIPSLTTAGILSPSTASWGYLIGTYDASTNSTWSPIPSSTDASAIILDPGLNAIGSYSNSTRISYGVATGATATGTYSDTLTYTATSIDSTPYTLTVANSNTTTSTNTLNLGYGDSTTITVTPTEGYYLSGYTCPTGYTCTLSNGDPIDTSANATDTQTIKVKNNSSANGGEISFTSSQRTFNVSLSASNASLSTTSLSVPYGNYSTVTVTPSSGYYISGGSCTNSNYTIMSSSGGAAAYGTSYTGATTYRIYNNSYAGTGSCSFTAAIAPPSVACGTTAGSTCTVNGVRYIRLADGNVWTKSSQGTTSWYNASSICPSGTSLPTAAQFDTLLSKYGGSAHSDYGSPYGYRASSGALYSATGWSGRYWSSTEYASYTSFAWFLFVGSSYAGVNNRDKSDSNNVVCIAS